MLSAVRPRTVMVLGCLLSWTLSIRSSAQTPAEAPATPAATDATAVPAADGGRTAVEPMLAWDLLHRRYNTWHGNTGGLTLVDASTGVPGAVRIQLGLDFFSGDDFLFEGDQTDFSSQTLSASVTPLKALELFATLANRSVSSDDYGQLESLGDFTFGLKVAGRIAPTLSIGGDLRAQLGGEEGGSGQAWDSTSVGLRAALSVNLNELRRPVPFVGRINVGYLFDSSANIVDEEEDRRYEELDDPARRDDESQHLVSRFERLAFGINRLDKLTIGAGVEIPLDLGYDFFLHPMAEWQIGIPVNRQDYDCPYFGEDGSSGEPSTDNDSCFERHPGVVPMNLLLGVRVVPPLRGLSVLLGADIGLSGTDRFVRELAPNLPYRVMIAVGYDFDARPAPERIVTVKVPGPAAAAPVAAPVGRIRGVVATAEGLAVAGAIVKLDKQETALSSGSDGSFVSEPFSPGAVHITVTHPDYENGVCPSQIPEAGGDVGVRCIVVAKPKVGAISGRVIDTQGLAVPGARVVVTGPSSLVLTANPTGEFEALKLPLGDYLVRIEALGYFTRQAKAQVTLNATTRVDVSVSRKPSRPGILLQPDSSVEAPALVWVGESVDLTATAEEAVAELAEVLMLRPDLSVRIQGYGSEAVARARAELIKQRLVAAGVAAHRIEAVGGGKRLRITLRQ